MRPPSKWVNYIAFFITSAHAVCTGDILRAHQQKTTPPTTEQFQASPSFYYHYQQHRGQPAQRFHIEYPQQSMSSTPQMLTTSRPFSRFTPVKPESALKVPPTPKPYVEYPVDDAEDRKNTSNKLYFEDHNGNDTYREHHYRHVTVNHYYYNATNTTEGADPNSKGKDVKHHYYYNEYKHDHRNKTDHPNEKYPYYNGYKPDNRNKTEDPDVKHHYYYNEYKHDHRNKTEDPGAKHHYYYNEYKHDHRNKTEDPGVKHYQYRQNHGNKTLDPVKYHYYDGEYKREYRNRTNGQPGSKHYHKEYTNEYRNGTDNPNGNHRTYYYHSDHRNHTGGTGVKHYYHSTNRTVARTEAPKVKHYYYKDENVEYDDYDESTSEEDRAPRKEHELNAPITDVHGIEDYEYVTPDPKPIVKHHHYYKEYHYKNGRLVANTTRAEPPKARPFRDFHNPASSGRYVGFPVIVKDASYDKRFAYVGGSGHPFFGWVRPHEDPSYRHRKPGPNGSSSGYYLVDPLGRLPIFRIHTSLPESYLERTSSRVHGYNGHPEAVPYHVARVQPVRRRRAPRYAPTLGRHSSQTSSHVEK